MLKGNSLHKNCKIGIVSPSSYEETSIINKKINEFSALGYNLKLGKHIYDKYSFFAGNDKERADDIMDMFLDKTVDGIMCFRGGYGSIRTIPFLDKDIIRNNPKFFCGFSDITILLNYFSALGLITFHGPMINSNFSDVETLKSFYELNSNISSTYTYNLTKYSSSISYINPHSFSGKIVGGNLSMICSSIGTPYEINTSNSILLIEEVNEAPYSIDRMITHLIYSDLIANCNGIIIGYLSDTKNYNNSPEKKILELTVIDRLKPLNKPIIIGFPFGHNYPNITIPIGCNASFSYYKQQLTFLDQFLI